MGKTVGRFANRIGNARFVLDGKEYRLSANCAGGHHIHGGGTEGFANKVWESRVETDRVVFSLFSPDGDQGYPGDLQAEVVYDWSDDCELEITYYAKTSAPTIINLTNHSYFNLKGEDRPGAMDQQLKLNSHKYLRYEANCICTGELVGILMPTTNRCVTDRVTIRVGRSTDMRKGNSPKPAFCMIRRVDGACGS